MLAGRKKKVLVQFGGLAPAISKSRFQRTGFKMNPLEDRISLSRVWSRSKLSGFGLAIRKVGSPEARWNLDDLEVLSKKIGLKELQKRLGIQG